MTDRDYGAHYSPTLLEFLDLGCCWRKVEFNPRVDDDLFLRLLQSHERGAIHVVRLEVVTLECIESIGSLSANAIIDSSARNTLLCCQTRKLHRLHLITFTFNSRLLTSSSGKIALNFHYFFIWKNMFIHIYIPVKVLPIRGI